MLDARQISPIQAFLGEVLLLTLLSTLTIASFSWSFWISVLAIIPVVIIAVLISYLLTYHPRVSLEDQKKSSFLKQYLRLVISDYESKYDPDYDIRVNIMIPYRVLSLGSKRDAIPFISYNKYLKIWAWAGGGDNNDIKAHDTGSSDETKIKWSIENPPEGNCGRAFVQHQVRAAGRKGKDDEWDLEQIAEHQAQATNQVNSVLSAPIRPPGNNEPIAVLNLDAAAPIDETNFTKDEVKRFVAEEYAEPIGTLL